MRLTYFPFAAQLNRRAGRARRPLAQYIPDDFSDYIPDEFLDYVPDELNYYMPDEFINHMQLFNEQEYELAIEDPGLAFTALLQRADTSLLQRAARDTEEV